jgi:hypothetical protein
MIVEWTMPLSNSSRPAPSQPKQFGKRRSDLSATLTAFRWRAHDRGELIVQSLGLVLAVASTTFATYMISNSERDPNFAGLEHLAIFSRPALGTHYREMIERQIAAAERRSVDYTPVGAIGSSTRNMSAPGFVLLGVNSGLAVVQAPNAIVRVSKGDMLDGLGRVMSIERRGNKWVVITQSGLIISN